MNDEIQQGIQVRARELLNLGEVGTVIGYERSPKGRVRPAFVYDEAEDSLVTVPSEYEHFDRLVEEIRAGVGDRFEVIEVAAKTTISEYLKSKVAPDDRGPEEETPDAEDSEDQDPDESQ